MTMFNISTQIEERLESEIKFICQSEKRSKSFIFREALDEFVSNYRVKRTDNLSKRQSFIAKLKNINKIKTNGDDALTMIKKTRNEREMQMLKNIEN